MHRRARLARATLLATIALALTAGSAEAQRSLSVSGRAITSVSRALSFVYGEGETLMICDVTLSGTLAQFMAKVQGARVGSITEAQAASCSTNLGESVAVTLTISLTLPWELQYRSFLGTLPNITGLLVNLVRTSWLWRLAGGGVRSECLYEGTVGMLVAIERGRTVNVRVLGPFALPLRRVLEQFFPLCPRSMTFQGTFTLEPAQTVTLV